MSGDELKKIRSRVGWTQAEMAYRLGVAPNTIARWERGEMHIGETAAKLIGRLGMETTAKAYEVKLKDQRTLFFGDITTHSATRSHLKLYRGTEVVAQFDMNDISSWFAPDRTEE